MSIRAMTVADLRMVLNWAAEEGWNPGLDDAEAFHAADPAGFLIKEVDGAPVAAVSVVNHDADFAFLGLYLCKPGFRGQGHGIDVWRAGISHAGTRSIGLDGVPDQQDNYARSGFVRHGNTVRFEGHIGPAPDARVRRASSTDTQDLIARDISSAGIQRTVFTGTWLAPASTRQTMVLAEGSEIRGFATFRRCGLGTKIGPFQAASKAEALVLLGSNPFATAGAPVFIDVQNDTSPLAHLLGNHGFTPVFETARMYRGDPPDTDPAPYQAIATMELG